LAGRNKRREAQPPATTLRSLLDTLGPPALRVLGGAEGLDAEVHGTAIFDPVEPMPEGHRSVLLLVGTHVDAEELPRLLPACVEHGFTALVVKLRGRDPGRLLEQAERLGLVVFATDDDLPWRRLDGLLVSVLGAGRLGADDSSGHGEALFAIANAVAAITGGSVAIEDLGQQVLAYSSVDGQRIDPLRERGILDRRVPDFPHHRPQYLQVLQAEGVTRFPAVADELPRAAVAVRAGELPLGTMWAIEGEGVSAQEVERALVDAARVAALHLLRSQDVNEREQHLRGEMLRAALAGAGAPEDLAERLRIGSGTQLSLAACVVVGEEHHEALLTRMGAAVARYAAAYLPEAVATTTLHAVYLLAPASPAALRRLVEGALPSLRQAAGAEVQAAISGAADDVAELVELRREVDAVIRAAGRGEGAPEVATVADVHSRLLLDRLADELRRDPRLRHPGIQQLVDHDRRRGTSYGESVLTWLEEQGDVAAAAQRLRVHPNTLRYRLRRLDERFGIAFDDPDSRLSAWLQLRLLPVVTPD
jgi:DNA-binding PucR family transcriptional regulator